MDKEQILSTLKEKAGNTSFSDRSLNDYIDNNLPTDGAEPDDAYWKKHVNIIKSFQGNYSADMSAAIAQQISSKSIEYFTKNPDKFKEFVKAHPELLETKETVDNGNDDKYKALEDKINAIIKQKDDEDRQSKINALRDKVKSKAKELKVTRNRLWNDVANQVEYSEGDTEDTFLRKVKDKYNSDFSEYYGDGEKPFQTNGNAGGGNGNGNKVINDYFAKKKAKMSKK